MHNNNQNSIETILNKHHNNIILEKYGRKFCASPWNSLHEGPGGLVSTCCKTRKPIGWSKENTFEQMYNSEHAKSVRSNILKGILPENCKQCSKMENEGFQAANRIHGNNMSNLNDMEDLIANTKSDGELLTHKPYWLDLLWTNKCNFACIGCTPELSSFWNDNFSKEHAILQGLPKDFWNKFENWDNGNTNKIDYIIKHSDTIRSIHLNGGEPWLQESTFELLEEMLKRGLNKKIQIWSHTNGSITKSYKGVDIIFDYLVHWKGELCKITMSNDGFGEKGNYVRYGYSDKKWLSTYNKIHDAGLKCSIQTCLGLFNSLSLKNIYSWYKDNCVSTQDGSLTLIYNDSINVQLLHFVESLKEKFLNDIQDMLNNKIGFVNWIPHYEKIIEYAKINNTNNDLQKKNLINLHNGITAFDAKRNLDRYKIFPELTELFNIAQIYANNKLLQS